jgi:hypothetical protein
MIRRLTAVLMGLGAVGLAQPSPAPGPGSRGLAQSFEVTTKDRLPFRPGGLIRVQNSYGYLTVEGWDEPEVDVTVTKSTDRFYESDEGKKAERLLDEVRVKAERRSDQEMLISTAVPHRNSPLTSRLPSGEVIVTTPVPPNNKRHVTVDYKILVPRDSNLIVRQDNGYVWVSGINGNLEIRSHTGDMIVMLPDPDAYTIDAETRFGRISSDVAGKPATPFLAGAHFVYASHAPARRVYLRMGRGSITIKNGPASGTGAIQPALGK